MWPRRVPECAANAVAQEFLRSAGAPATLSGAGPARARAAVSSTGKSHTGHTSRGGEDEVGRRSNLAASVLAAGCITVPDEDTRIVGGSAPTGESGHGDPPEPQAGKAEGPATIEERWRCEDIILTSTCYPSLGSRSCSGTVKTGKYPAKPTFFRVNGIDRLWSWPLSLTGDGFDYMFVIARGYGRYYDFRGVPAGEKTKPSEVFTCSETGR